MPELVDNLASILSTWIGVHRDGSWAQLAAILDEQVVWEGVLPGQDCHNRDEVLGLLARRQRPLRLTGIVPREVGDRVAISVEGPDILDTEEQAAGEPHSLLFTFRDGEVVRIDSATRPDELFAQLISYPDARLPCNPTQAEELPR